MHVVEWTVESCAAADRKSGAAPVQHATSSRVKPEAQRRCKDPPVPLPTPTPPTAPIPQRRPPAPVSMPAAASAVGVPSPLREAPGSLLNEHCETSRSPRRLPSGGDQNLHDSCDEVVE
jgi:hypothetical protein